MDFIHHKALQQFKPSRQKIIKCICKMTRSEIGESISEAFLLNHIQCDLDFKKQLNNRLSADLLSNLKCGTAHATFVIRVGSGGNDDQADELLDVQDVQTKSGGNPLDLLIAAETLAENLGKRVIVTAKSLAADLKVTTRQARRIMEEQLRISKIQHDMFYCEVMA